MWTETDRKRLINLYPDRSISIAKIAELLGKTQSSIRAEASRLKLVRPLNKTNETFQAELARLNVGIINIDPYISANVKIRFKCLEGHEFTIVPRSILERKKCPACSISGFKTNEKAYVYCIEYLIDEFPFYKIGVTNRTPRERASFDLKLLNGNIVWEKLYNTGLEALQVEKRLKEKYKKFSINTGLLKSGNTETFSVYVDMP